MKERAAVLNRGRGSGDVGFTLTEMLVAVLVGLLIVVGVHRIFVSGLTTQTTTSLETEVNRKAQVAIDDLLRRLRGGQRVLDAAADRIAFADQDGNTVRYWVDESRLYRAVNTTRYEGGTLLARGVSHMLLSYYDGAGQPTSDPGAATRVVVEVKVERASHAAVLRSGVRLRNR